MPKGKVLSLELREIISRHHIQQHQTAEQIYADIFDGDPNRISIQYLRKLCRSLRHQNFRSAYLCGGMKQTGRPLQQNYFHRALIREHILSNKHMRVCTMYRTYCEMFYPEANANNNNDDGLQILSLSSFKRILKGGKLTRKVMERRHIHQNPVEGLQYLESIAHIQPLFIIDCDETKQSPESYLQKFGYAPVGEACQKDQVFINGTAYSTIAAVCPLGYIAWRTFEGNIDHEVFNDFLINSLGPHVLPHHHLVLGNAAIHHVPETRQVIEALFHGNYWYSARYSPHLKPIEP